MVHSQTFDNTFETCLGGTDAKKFNKMKFANMIVLCFYIFLSWEKFSIGKQHYKWKVDFKFLFFIYIFYNYN